MTTAKQTFPAVTIEALPNGLLRLEDESNMNGIMVVDLHPAQVQVLASMAGFNMPDKTRHMAGRIRGRVAALKAQACELEGLLRHALHEQGIDVVPELRMAEFIAHDLSEVFKDLEDLTEPDLVPTPETLANPGGQLTLPV